MIYEKFLLEENEKIVFHNYIGVEGLNIVPSNFSELEQCENRNQIKIIEAIFFTVCELFEIDDVEMQFTSWSISFSLITKEETQFNNQKVFESPQLSRKKIGKAEAIEIAEAIIDLLRNRKKWDKETFYKTMYLD